MLVILEDFRLMRLAQPQKTKQLVTCLGDWLRTLGAGEDFTEDDYNMMLEDPGQASQVLGEALDHVKNLNDQQKGAEAAQALQIIGAAVHHLKRSTNLNGLIGVLNLRPGLLTEDEVCQVCIGHANESEISVLKDVPFELPSRDPRRNISGFASGIAQFTQAEVIPQIQARQTPVQSVPLSSSRV